MRRLIAALVLIGAMTGCSSSGGANTTSSASVGAPSAAPSDYATQAEAVAATCAAFDTFLTDLNRLTPRGSQIKLVADAQAVQAPLIRTDAELDDVGQRIFDDVNLLVMHVGSSSWPETGTPLDPEITAVQDDCTSA